jgi:hypothetical protein
MTLVIAVLLAFGVRLQEPPIPRNGLAIGPGVLNDPFFGEFYRWAIPELQSASTVLPLASFESSRFTHRPRL